MATLHKEFIKFNKNIKLTPTRKEDLVGSRNAIKDKIKKYFREEKSRELQPKFHAQGSFEMNTTVNPIPEYDNEGNKLLKYDLDYGVYFFEKENQNNRKSIDTWHSWVYNAVENHTNTRPQQKTTCVRVYFSDGHHIDLPIYYKKGNGKPELAHRKKSWLISNPVEFTEWFNNEAKKDQQLRRIVRYLKAWKNYRQIKNTHLKLPSGFALTILATNNFTPNRSDDVAFMNTVKAIRDKLNRRFECLRPTTPKGENVFGDYSTSRENDFMNTLNALLNNCLKAHSESNFRKASEYMRKEFGDRFPLGEDATDNEKSSRLGGFLGASIAKKPYGK